MNYQIINYKLFHSLKLKTFAKLLASFLIIIFLVFLANITSSQKLFASTPDCSQVGSPSHGANCLFSFDGNILPLCNEYKGSRGTVQPQNIISNDANPIPRDTCMNLSDLPLCSENGFIPEDTNKKCVKKCSNIAKPDDAPSDAARGIDFAVHDKDCVRFCHEPEPDLHSTVDLKDNQNCKSAPFCHQYPDIDNCEILSCYYLTAEELNNDKYVTQQKRYCNGFDHKCFEFPKDKLKYLKTDNGNNTMCILHNNQPESILCGRGSDIDHTLQIENKGSDFKEEYYKYFLQGIYINCTSPYQKIRKMCEYNAATGIKDDVSPCSAEDFTQECINNKCQKATPYCLSDEGHRDSDCILDCSDDELHSDCANYKTQCSPAGGDDPNLHFCEDIIKKVASAPTVENIENDNDIIESWFYRPSPHPKSFERDKFPDTNTSYVDFINKYRIITHDQKSQDPRYFENICYNKQNIKDNRAIAVSNQLDYGYFGDITLGDILWMDYAAGKTKSPGNCTSNSMQMSGARGTGYTYLCDTGHLYGKALKETAYYKGYVKPSFGTNGDDSYYVDICVRFHNSMIPGYSCGKRECGINYAFDGFTGNVCGGDVCKTLKIDSNDKKKCHLEDSESKIGLFNSWLHREEGYECSADIDNEVRIRAVQFDNYICAFLDSTNQLGHQGVNNIDLKRLFPYRIDIDDHNKDLKYGERNKTEFEAAQELFYRQINPSDSSSKFCMSGEKIDGEEKCNKIIPGNHQPYLSLTWRTFLQVEFVDRDYYQHNILGLKQKRLLCAPIELRIDPPTSYSIATIENSEKLFVPSIKITAVHDDGKNKRIIGRTDPTDFYFPSIEVTMNNMTAPVSGQFNKKLIDRQEMSIDIKEEKTSSYFAVDFIDAEYSKNLIVEKTMDPFTKTPTICLKRKFMVGNKVQDSIIECKNRKYPEIDNGVGEKAIISVKDQASTSEFNPGIKDTYENFKMAFKLSAKINDIEYTTNEIIYRIPDSTNKACQELEGYVFCVQRDECSQLELEYIQNEFDINNRLNCLSGSDCMDLDQLLDKRKSFYSLKNECDEKRGIYKNPITSEVTDTYADKAYGWFNELCIVSGFETKLGQVVAYKIGTIDGKCLIDGSRKDPSLDCSEGGNAAKGCYCKEYQSGMPINQNEILRSKTPREAGLCIDIPKAKICPAISFTDRGENHPDQYYVTHSLGKDRDETSDDGYNDIDGVHLYHQERSNDPNEKYADFPISYVGMGIIIGSCNGFFQETTYGSKPKAICEPPSGESEEGFLYTISGCDRFSCPAIDPKEPNNSGEYNLAKYFRTGDSEIEQQGRRYGFANWDKYTKTNDFLESTTATSCVTGFKPINSNYIDNDDNEIADIEDNFEILASLSNSRNIKDHQKNVTMPSLTCSQRGSYMFDTLQNSCQRIKCFIKDPPEINEADDIEINKEKYKIWHDNGGAIFTPSRIIANENLIDDNDADEVDANISNHVTQQDLSTIGISGKIHQNNIISTENPNIHYALASRNSDDDVIQPLSVIKGECSNEVGFFQIGAQSPTRICDHLGNLSEVQNKCATRCNEVVETPSSITQLQSDSIHGYATWPQTDVIGETELISLPIANSIATYDCLPGRIKYPYPPMRNAEGKLYKFEYLNSNEQTKIINQLIEGYSAIKGGTAMDLDVKQDTRYRSNTYKPKRSCKSVKITGTNSQANIWTATDSDCINKCPGFNKDPRINVGLTIHPFSNSSTDNIFGTTVNEFFGPNIIAIKWPETNLGQWHHIQGRGPNEDQRDNMLSDHNENHYLQNSSGHFSVSRYCNNDGKWSDPIINCVARGVVELGTTNARYTAPSPDRRLPANDIIYSGQCKAELYYNAGKTTATGDNIARSTIPYKCVAPADGSESIDKYYLQQQSVGHGCVQKCRGPGPYKDYGGSTTGSKDYSNNLFSQNNKIDLNCRNNYGNRIISGVTNVNNVQFNCDSDQEYIGRSSIEPYLICDFDTPGGWKLMEDCSMCRNCNSSSSINSLADKTVKWWCAKHKFNQDAKSARSNIKVYTVPQSLNHNATYSVCAYSADKLARWRCNSNCNYVHQNMDFKCIDGSIVRSWGSGGENDCQGDEWDKQYERKARWECGTDNNNYGGYYIDWD